MKPTGKTHKKAKKIKQPSEPRGCIYLLTNLVNGKRYVGQYKNVERVHCRWNRHIGTALNTGDTRPLYRALRKGKARKSDKWFKNFTAEIIWRGPVSQLNWKETYYIKKLHTFIDDPLGDRSYNLTTGGKQFKFSEDVKARQRARALRQFENPAARAEISMRLYLRYENASAHEKTSIASTRSAARGWATRRANAKKIKLKV